MILYYLKEIKRKIKMPFRFVYNIWSFRKELWEFRNFDYQFNISIFLKSLDISASFYESGNSLTSSSDEKAREIREFIHFIQSSLYQYDEATRLTGISFNEAHNHYLKSPSGWRNNDPKTWTNEQLAYVEYTNACNKIESEYWDLGMNLLKDKMRSWWD